MRFTDGRVAVALDEVTIGDAAVICAVRRDEINRAMGDGRLRYRRAADSRRVAKLADVLSFRKRLWGAR